PLVVDTHLRHRSHAVKGSIDKTVKRLIITPPSAPGYRCGALGERSMTRLSAPIDGIQDHYSVVVVGSGYGGGIAASRMARAGQSVCVLERGREFQPGEYPNTEPTAL